LHYNNPILAVGSIAFDDLETPNGIKKNVLGGSATYFSIAASLFSNVKIVGVVGDDFPQYAWDLFNKKNIGVQNVQSLKGETFHWGGRYNDDYSSRETLFTNLGVFENFIPSIKTADLNSRFLFLGNILPDLQLNVISKIQAHELVITDTMNLWIDISKKQLSNVISKTDVLLLNDEEALQYTGTQKLNAAAAQLREEGPGAVIIKLGSKGAYLSSADCSCFVPAFKVNKVIDPTGAGDSFAGGFIGCLAATNEIDFLNAVIVGSAVASFTVEGFGLEGLLEASTSCLQTRIDYIKNEMEMPYDQKA
tara:strand:- start:1679 stop:2599 length:921 start_codon:yes stop_codon:yes gene_type:complete